MDAAENSSAQTPRWRPLNAKDRRVLGVLVEKAKTTPDAYPMTLNSLVNGANQKTNRRPLTQLTSEDVEASLERLREMGAVGLIQGMGRVEKFRHYAYEWLGVDKAESAVMTELLLRGPQSEGELRSNVQRMENLPDLSALRTVLESLKRKGLVQGITPAGRGHVVSHLLFEPREWEKICAQYAAAGGGDEGEIAEESPSPAPRSAPVPAPARSSETVAQSTSSAASLSPAATAVAGAPLQAILERELANLRNEIRDLREQLDAVAEKCTQQGDELTRLREALGA